MTRKFINGAVGLVTGALLGFVLFNLLKAFFGSTWSIAEGGPWLVIYSPYIVLAVVGALVGFLTKIKKAIVCCVSTMLAFLIGGLILMFVAGMFIGGGAIYVVAIIGYLFGGIFAFNTIIKNT